MALTPIPINASTVPGGASIQADIIDNSAYEVVKQAFGVEGVATMVSEDDPLPVGDAAVLAKLSSDPATQTTLAALLAKIIAAPSTEAKQDAEIVLLNAIGTLLSGILTISGNVNANTGLAQPLTDTQLRASSVPVSLAAVPLATGAATSGKQDEQTALITTLNSLIETNNTLVQLLAPLAGAMNAGAPALRTIPIASVSTAVTGSVTATVASTSITNFGTGIPASEMAHDINNFTAIAANINNVTP